MDIDLYRPCPYLNHPRAATDWIADDDELGDCSAFADYLLNHSVHVAYAIACRSPCLAISPGLASTPSLTGDPPY